MPRILVKGGIWKNTEDEILKVAVMKYGKNQWSRIASLLHKKTAKQCKARWYEWLDPSIKKTEWSRDEDEKLLHLAKLMPTQWRTIAPIVGRTASQCLERYEYLLDQAQNPNALLGERSDEDPRKLRPGEIDPNPETKPARPDPIDMDEDELEMLSEARARLANTQGKKAKRKARERQLEEARRLATLQKKRELRAAGIELQLKIKRHKREINYNAEIPFEKKPISGFYDTSNEKIEADRIDFKRLSKEAVVGKRKDVEEDELRRKDKEKLKRKEDENLPQSLAQLNRELKLDLPSKRSKLVLPEPQVGRSELEQVVKLGTESENARSFFSDEHPIPSSNITNILLGEYNMTPSLLSTAANQQTPNPGAKPSNLLRTPQTPIFEDRVMMEAQNILALSMVDTPLKGGVNTPLDHSRLNFQSATPVHTVVQTPNTLLATPSRDTSQQSSRSGKSNTSMNEISSRSVRDSLRLNQVSADLATPISTPMSESALASSYSSQSGQNLKDLRANLKLQLSNLPRPSDDYEIVLPEESDIGQEESQSFEDSIGIDAEEIDKKEQLRILEEESKFYNLLPKAIQRGLPIPTDVNLAILKSADLKSDDENALKDADEMIKAEMLNLIRLSLVYYYSSKEDLTSGNAASSSYYISKSTLKEHQAALKSQPIETFSMAQIEEARKMLQEEMSGLIKQHPEIKFDLNDEEYSVLWEDCYSQLFLMPNQKRYTQIALASNKNKIDAYSNELENNRKIMAAEAQKAAKIEKKLKILIQGYMNRSVNLEKKLTELHEAIQQARIDENCYRRLYEVETKNGPERLRKVKEEYEAQVVKESALQEKYRELTIEKHKLLQKINVPPV